jgi:hypothetical protein
VRRIAHQVAVHHLDVGVHDVFDLAFEEVDASVPSRTSAQRPPGADLLAVVGAEPVEDRRADNVIGRVERSGGGEQRVGRWGGGGSAQRGERHRARADESASSPLLSHPGCRPLLKHHYRYLHCIINSEIRGRSEGFLRENGSRASAAVVPVALACALIAGRAVSAAAAAPISVAVNGSDPPGLDTRAAQQVSVQDKGDVVILANGFLRAEISSRSGVLLAVQNLITGERYVIENDVVGISVAAQGRNFDWTTSHARPGSVTIRTSVADARGAAQVIARHGTSSGGEDVAIVYDLNAKEFWLRRRLIYTNDAKYTVDGLVYGALHVESSKNKQLNLGKFDRPTIGHGKLGGLFGGVEHWFYQLDEGGIYRNDKTAWQQSGRFEAEPFYVGVFADAPGEPYAGWTWYRTYLDRAKKAAAAKHPTWLSWNAGWGQWGIDIDDATAGDYLRLMKNLGIDGVIFGSGGFGKGIARFAELAKTDLQTQVNVALLDELHIAGGTLNNGSKSWADAEKFPALLDELHRYRSAGFRCTAFDFFESPDNYAAHRRVREYFAAAREQLDYTECHLGMAAYGPQFQRMVRVNHPNDIAGFDISHFSANWATFLAFRDSRREWQRKYDYLMPEDGLYYFVTHYANWGNPRRYTDPEPQQFLWSVPAYCGIGFNFHDTFGWRESIVAASAFTAAPVFGHIELKMPPRDVAFAKEFFAWMKQTAASMPPPRVCAETAEYCVVSRVRDGRGMIHVLNYLPGTRELDLKLSLIGPAKTIAIRQVYPVREDSGSYRDGDTLHVRVRGESSAIFALGDGSLPPPPEHRSRFPIDVELARAGEAWSGRFDMPDVRKSLAAGADSNLPRELISLEQVQDTRPELLVDVGTDAGGKKFEPAVKWIGKGKLPQSFIDVYGFRDGQAVETWKIVPWAYADRVWLVVRPVKPLPLAGPHPTLKLNAAQVPLYPRVDHRVKDVAKWNCPLYHADVTAAVRFAQPNELQISIPGQSDSPIVYVTCGAAAE